MTTEERKKLEQANREGRDWGMRIGTDAMRLYILKMPGLPPELAEKIKAIDIENFKAGTKTEEYREVTPFWMARLQGKTFDKIVITLGYPSKSNKDRRLEFPWRGCTTKTIKHPHFGDRKLSVFAIKLERP